MLPSFLRNFKELSDVMLNLFQHLFYEIPKKVRNDTASDMSFDIPEKEITELTIVCTSQTFGLLTSLLRKLDDVISCTLCYKSFLIDRR